MRRAAILALAVVVGGGLWLSASSTLRLAARHDVPAGAAPALVVVLEVAAVIGTALWVTAPPGERRDPAVVVCASCSVAGVGGWSAYGWLGLVGPAAVVFVAHMVAKRWAELDEPAPVPYLAAPTADEKLTVPPTEATPAPPTAAPTAREGDEALVADLAARPTLPGRDAVKAEFSVGTRRADRVLAAARALRRPHLVTAEEATS